MGQRLWTLQNLLLLCLLLTLPVASYRVSAQRAPWRPQMLIPLRNAVDFLVTRDGKTLIVAVNEAPSNRHPLNSEIQFWNIDKKNLHAISNLVFSLDQTRFAALGGQGCGNSSAWCGRVKIFNRETRKLLHTSEVIGTAEHLSGFMTPDKVLIASEAEHIQVWNRHGTNPEWSLRTSSGPWFAFSPQHQLIARHVNGQSQEVYQARTRKLLHRHSHIRPQANDTLGPMEFSPDGKLLAV
jgi:hypothetical protein